jgi:DNA polymerase-1
MFWRAQVSEPKPTYCVIDVETTMNSPIGNPGTPFHPDNKVVLHGWRCGHWDRAEGVAIQESPPTFHKINRNRAEAAGAGKFCQVWFQLLVGHHIGYDIHHCLKNGALTQEFLGTVDLWDTQLAEYLLTAQRSTYASLDELAAKYGGTKKDEDVSAMFKAGHGADKVPLPRLRSYLEDDVSNTELVFYKQFEKAKELGMLPLIQTRMDSLAATIEMTYNGMAVDMPVLLEGAKKLRDSVDALENIIRIEAERDFDYPDFNVGSTKQLSTVLFGGERKWIEREQVGVTKAGKPKYRNVEKTKKIAGNYDPALLSLEKNGKGDYPTDDKTLSRLLGAFPKDVLEYREKSKQLGTYWEGILKLVMPDGCIHHSLNHCVTRTGRLSSSDPNLQNVTNGDIKKVFVSRWGKDGVIVEADFAQLEMVELAERSGDEQLLKDIEEGVDMHNALFESMYGRSMHPLERKKFKRCSFALVYGAGPGGIAEQGGITKEEAKKFIATFYGRYKGVQRWHEELVAMAATGRVNHGLKDPETGYPVGEYEHVDNATGMRWWHKEYPTDWGTINFSPTELKNYPVQGGATGIKVPLCIGKLYRVLRNHPELKDKCLMINTVHDSVLFDIHVSVIDEALRVIKTTMERTPEFYEQTFGHKLRLPLKVGISVGPNWLEQDEVKFDAANSPMWDEIERKAA